MINQGRRKSIEAIYESDDDPEEK